MDGVEESAFVGLLGAKDRIKTDMSPVRDINEYDLRIVGKISLLRCTSGDAEYQTIRQHYPNTGIYGFFSLSILKSLRMLCGAGGKMGYAPVFIILVLHPVRFFVSDILPVH